MEFPKTPLNYQNSQSLKYEKKIRSIWELKKDPEKRNLLLKADYPFFAKHIDMVSPEAIEAALKISKDIKKD